MILLIMPKKIEEFAAPLGVYPYIHGRYTSTVQFGIVRMYSASCVHERCHFEQMDIEKSGKRVQHTWTGLQKRTEVPVQFELKVRACRAKPVYHDIKEYSFTPKAHLCYQDGHEGRFGQFWIYLLRVPETPIVNQGKLCETLPENKIQCLQCLVLVPMMVNANSTVHKESN